MRKVKKRIKNLKMTGSIKAFKVNYFKSTIRSNDNVRVGGLAHGPAIGNEALVITTHMTTDIEGILCFHRFSEMKTEFHKVQC